MRDIIDKKHDKNVCKINCEENGKVFNQTPFQCHYVSKGQNYNNLLKYQEFNDSDILDDVKVAPKSTKDNCLYLLGLLHSFLKRNVLNVFLKVNSWGLNLVGFSWKSLT